MPYQGTTGPQGSWEETYRKTPASELPWNSGMADGDLMDLVASGKVPPGRAWDLGCGPGHDAAYLSQKGWNVTAVDISPTALQLARDTARKAGMEEKITFLAADVLALPGPGDAVLVHDRGCFHTLPSDSWETYHRTVSGLLGKGGILALKVFSSKMPSGRGPFRFTPEGVREVFGADFELAEIKEGFFSGPYKPVSLFCVFVKRA